MFIPLLVAALFAASGAEDPNARIDRIESSMYAPCCYQETVKTHRSEVALQMKAEIARMVSEGKSDEQIFDFYKQRYGQRIMLEPEGRAAKVAVMVPVLFGIVGFFVLAYFVKRWKAAAPAAVATTGALHDVDDEDF
jgi:cytochrome c-type biogenesis protein CcmH